ncbi:MAG: hypothetical protein AB7O68_15205 [Pirellulales bacterium]
MTLGQVGKVRLELPLFVFKPLQLYLDASKPSRAEALEHFHETCNLGMDLSQSPARQVVRFA